MTVKVIDGREIDPDRRYYIVKNWDTGTEFVCEACTDDDDTIISINPDGDCERCGVSQLPY